MDGVNPAILRIAAAICTDYADMMGDRMAQDVSLDIEAEIAKLSIEDLDWLHQIFERHNSEGRDYVPGQFASGDGLTMGIAIAQALNGFVEALEHDC